MCSDLLARCTGNADITRGSAVIGTVIRQVKVSSWWYSRELMQSPRSHDSSLERRRTGGQEDWVRTMSPRRCPGPPPPDVCRTSRQSLPPTSPSPQPPATPVQVDLCPTWRTPSPPGTSPPRHRRQAWPAGAPPSGGGCTVPAGQASLPPMDAIPVTFA